MITRRRGEIDSRLSTPLSDAEWKYLTEKGFVADAEWDSPSGGAAGAAAEVRRHRAVGWGRSARTRSARPPLGWHRTRAAILGRLYARLAEEDGEVQRVRAELDGLSDRACGRPHEAGLSSWIEQQLYAAFGAKSGDASALGRAMLAHLGSDRGSESLCFPDGRGARIVEVPTSSVLARVAELSAALADRYRWEQWDATRWLVCGGDPPEPWLVHWQLTLRRVKGTDTTTRLLLEVDPVFSPAELAAMYGHIRAQLRPGRRFRPLDKSALARVNFYVDAAENSSQWDEWRRRWNQGPGRKHGTYSGVGGGPSNFRRDVRNAFSRLRWVGWKQPDR